MRFVWIPEAPAHPGVYARKPSLLDADPSTMNAHDAMHFATEQECQKWCDENLMPVFVPREHGFDETPPAGQWGAR